MPGGGNSTPGFFASEEKPLTAPEQPDTEPMEPETEDGAAGDSGAGDTDAEGDAE